MSFPDQDDDTMVRDHDDNNDDEFPWSGWGYVGPGPRRACNDGHQWFSHCELCNDIYIYVILQAIWRNALCEMCNYNDWMIYLWNMHLKCFIWVKGLEIIYDDCFYKTWC